MVLKLWRRFEPRAVSIVTSEFRLEILGIFGDGCREINTEKAEGWLGLVKFYTSTETIDNSTVERTYISQNDD